jgi:4-hydroxy-tetrahydrodipicolinate reductase
LWPVEVNCPANIVIHGAKGRMGRALAACAARSPDFKVVGQIDLGDQLETALAEAHVVIDFSFHSATPAVAALCAQRQLGLVIGTTGHTPEEKSQIENQKSKISMVWSANFSLGVNALFWLTRKAAEILGPGFDLEIVEMHHRLKKDAPSGTAATLAAILADARRQQLQEVIRHGRVGITGERAPAEIGMHSVRGGDIVGDHTVIFAGEGERLELTHKASNRETFALGALRAARWVIGRPPGLYDMRDVLGLR